MRRPFVLDVSSGQVSGSMADPQSDTAARDTLLLAIHGGTYTHAYFDVPGYSLLERAAAAGFTVLAIDRPGYGQTTPLADTPDMLHENAIRISEFLPQVLSKLSLEPASVVVLGHSMGGVIATTIAAMQPSWPLVAMAGSGFARELPAHFVEVFAELPEGYEAELPTPMKDELMFGPPETLGPSMPQASHIANAPIPRAELIDIGVGWRDRAADVMARVSVPVHYRLAEFEQLWHVGDLESVAALYSSAPSVDARVMQGAGHCIDFHGVGAAYQDEILAFAAAVDGGDLRSS